ncbi:MAG: hypothetical protein JSW00_06065, partial [Thermoplasmata archaeon]
MRKVSLILLVSFFVLLSCLTIVPTSIKADPITTVTIQIGPTSRDVDVAPGSTGIVSFPGNVTCETYNTAAPCMVELSANSTIGSVGLSPAGMIFQGAEDNVQQFVVDVTVPLLTSCSEEHSCTIEGTWTHGARSGQAEPDTFQIIILPFYRPEIFCELPEKEVTKGDSVNFNLNINNSGNTDDVYQVDIANKDELEHSGITFEAIDKIAILEQGADNVELKVHTSSDTNEKVYEIRVAVYSTLDDEPEKFEFILALEVKEDAFDVGDIFNP